MATPIDLKDSSDEALMCLWVASRQSGPGRVEAFRHLWRRHRQTTYRMIVQLLGAHESLADEVSQDAWLEVIRATRYVPGSFKRFIRTIATRKALDKLASAALQIADQQESKEAGDQAVEHAPIVAEADPSRTAHAREATRLLLEISEGMPPAQRHAWTLRYLEEMTYDEVAAMMETPIGTAKARVRLARAFLAEGLIVRGIDPAELEESC